MGREREDEPELEPEASGSEPAGDSAGVYFMSVEDFEARLPRPSAEEEPPEGP